MGHPMNFQVVVLCGGTSKKLFPIVSQDVPKVLLPVGNRPVLSYVLELFEASNLKDLIVVVAGKDSAVLVGNWISAAYHDHLNVKVETVAEDVGTADALRAVAHHLTAEDILVVSGDLICDVPLGTIAAAHRRQQAAVTALLFKRSTVGPSDWVPGSGGHDQMKQPAPSDIIGLDTSHQFVYFMSSGTQVEKELRIRKSILRGIGQMEIHTDLVDAHLYAFKRSILQEVLEHRPGIHSIKHDLVPYLVRSQLRFVMAAAGEMQREDVGEGLQAVEKNVFPSRPTKLRCCAYLAGTGKYCARVNSIQDFSDANRDVSGEAIYLTGYLVSSQNNVIDSTAQFGSKSTVGPHCIFGEGSQMGDKCSVKRSIVGRHCRIGSNVKIMKSVIMDHVTVEDGCHIQGSIICSNVHLQERVALKDCQVGPGYVVASGTEHKAESFAKRDRN